MRLQLGAESPTRSRMSSGGAGPSPADHYSCRPGTSLDWRRPNSTEASSSRWRAAASVFRRRRSCRVAGVPISATDTAPDFSKALARLSAGLGFLRPLPKPRATSWLKAARRAVSWRTRAFSELLGFAGPRAAEIGLPPERAVPTSAGLSSSRLPEHTAQVVQPRTSALSSTIRNTGAPFSNRPQAGEVARVVATHGRQWGERTVTMPRIDPLRSTRWRHRARRHAWHRHPSEEHGPTARPSSRLDEPGRLIHAAESPERAGLAGAAGALVGSFSAGFAGAGPEGLIGEGLGDGDARKPRTSSPAGRMRRRRGSSSDRASRST